MLKIQTPNVTDEEITKQSYKHHS